MENILAILEPMLLFAAVCQAAKLANQIAVEFKDPLITRSGYNQENQSEVFVHDSSSFTVDVGDVNLQQGISPRSPFGFHAFLEKSFEFEKQPYVTQKNNKHFIDGLESPVDKLTIASVYVQKTLNKKHKIEPWALLNVSCKEYYDPDQCNQLAMIFSSLGYGVRTIPESLAMAVYNSKKIGDTAYQYYLNLNGSSAVSTVYKISKDADRTVIALEKLQIEEDVCSEYEKKIVDFLKSKIKTTMSVAFLPYDDLNNSEFYVNFKPAVQKFIRNYTDGLPECTIYQLDIHNTKNQQVEGAIIDTVIPITEFVNMLEKNSSQVTMNDLCRKYKDLYPESNLECFLISDIKPSKGFLGSFQFVPTGQKIIDGLFSCHDTKYQLEDSRIVKKERAGWTQADQDARKQFEKAMDELEFKRRIIGTVIPDISDRIANYKYLTQEEVKQVTELVEQKSRKMSILRDIDRKWDALVRLNIKREADSQIRPKILKDINQSISEAKKMIEERVIEGMEEFEAYLNGTIQLVASEATSDELKKRDAMLGAHIRLVQKKLEQQKALQAEEERKLQEQKPEEEKEVSQVAGKEEKQESQVPGKEEKETSQVSEKDVQQIHFDQEKHQQESQIDETINQSTQPDKDKKQSNEEENRSILEEVL